MKERHKYESALPNEYIKYSEKIDKSLDDMEKRILEQMYEPDKMF
jgi:hypothetical protein